ncbi:histidine kinase dimerization/phospho-acceptor domain-containing protein [Dietzia sp. JS16-p6b]|uniref:histidine kinase dimerization/phospho-acceptor domain-containing protein n=1 Tax=Dietzia sp. JS16-p6b TaxID=2052657 RepID=UPI001F44C086|nr:histidine kinase dimerization/phospho-acceptor domain-containing protein [Dietzia sp. JS16-p6b]
MTSSSDDDLRPIPVAGDDEIARLTASFNQMLVALGESRERQSRLVADAGHELKTPLTSLRTNVELLIAASRPGAPTIPDADRGALEVDVVGQISELTQLVGDLVELAREDSGDVELEPVAVSEAVERALERVRRRRHDVHFDVELARRSWREILDEAAKAGGATFYGTGMNPGLNQILGIVASADVAEIENVTTIESVDVSCHHSAETWKEVGYGRPVDDPALPGMLRKYTEVFADSVHMMADAFDLELDEVVFDCELGACTEDVDLGWYQLPAGSLGGSYIKYLGMVDGVSRIETHLEWQMTPRTEPKWDIKGCYITMIKGDPQIYNKHMIFPAPGVDLSDPEDFASIGMTVTGLPALNSIRSVIAAPPGIVTSADLPLRTFAGRFAK